MFVFGCGQVRSRFAFRLKNSRSKLVVFNLLGKQGVNGVSFIASVIQIKEKHSLNVEDE